ncbi:MAG: glycosyltransferase family 2 protein [Chitinophagales bacterium]|nr:glycosyltransferase family 2 protein [Chitinophagales bacterium]
MELSIVIPVYKSKLILPEMLNRIQRFIGSLDVLFEVILVDDFSNDGTKEVIGLLSDRYKFVRSYFNSINIGLPGTSAFGISKSIGKYIVTIDDDLEYCPSDIVKLYQFILETNADVVFGISPQKYKIQGKNNRFANLRNRFLNKLWKKPITDSFKIFKRTVVFDKDRFIMYTHFEGHLNRYFENLDVQYLEVAYYPRFQGKSNYTFMKKMQMFFQMHKGFR